MENGSLSGSQKNDTNSNKSAGSSSGNPFLDSGSYTNNQNNGFNSNMSNSGDAEAWDGTFASVDENEPNIYTEVENAANDQPLADPGELSNEWADPNFASGEWDGIIAPEDENEPNIYTEETPTGVSNYGMATINNGIGAAIDYNRSATRLNKSTDMKDIPPPEKGTVVAAPVDGVDGIEHKIRLFVDKNRIRIKDFFVDFDSLRSGNVTQTRFARCLDKGLKGAGGIQLDPMEVDKLAQRYLVKDDPDKMVSYRHFVDSINRDFDPTVVRNPPCTQMRHDVPYLGTERSMTHVSKIKHSCKCADKDIYEVLAKIAFFYKYRSINIRCNYIDFDPAKSGRVTSAIFMHAFPGPPEVQHDDIIRLVTYYEDPVHKGYVNYLNFRDDLKQVQDDLYGEDSPATDYPKPEPVKKKRDPKREIRYAIERIRVMVHKNGIRTTSFFIDHDPLRSYLITRSQFCTRLKLCVGKEAQLTDREVQLIADYYKSRDGRINYKPFCDAMEHGFNVQYLDKMPRQHPGWPASGALSRPLGQLTPSEEKRYNVAMNYIVTEVRRRQLLLQPYFKDYDRAVGYTRIVTRLQFSRVLSSFNILPKPEYLELIFRKFAEPYSGDVNYPAFCEAVDHEFVHSTVDDAVPPPDLLYVPPPVERDFDISKVNMTEVLGRIRHLITTKRIRVNEYFRDWDLLRSGLVTRPIFARCLTQMGVDWLTPTEVFALQERYKSRQKSERVSWYAYRAEVQDKIEPRDLEVKPDKKVKPWSDFVMPEVGAVLHDNELAIPHQVQLDTAMGRMRERVLYRGVDLLPFFKNFDPHNNGHVSQFHWRQVLSQLDLVADEREFKIVSRRFSDAVGFDYMRFIDQLAPLPRLHPQYSDQNFDMLVLNDNRKPPELNPVTKDGIEAVIHKIKIVAKQKRMRPHEFFKDYDVLNRGILSKNNFRRALDLAYFGLKESERELLCEYYESPKWNDHVAYLHFCDEIESIYTLKHLDKRPTVTPRQFQVPADWHHNDVRHDQEALEVAMSRLARHVSTHGSQLFTFFEDYDVTHNGHVSKAQFERVLAELNLTRVLSEYESKLICKRFEVLLGERRDVNYVAFADAIYSMAGIELHRP